MASETGTLNVTRDSLMALSAGADSYRFLSVALAVLEQAAEDAELLIQVVRHYAMLGLGGPALEVAGMLPETVRRELEASGAIRKLEVMPTGHVPWTRLARRFEANLEVLTRRFPELERLARDWACGQSGLELYQCRDGNYQVCTRNERGQRTWVPKLLDHKGDAERAPIPGLSVSLTPPPYLLEGVGLGGYFPKLIERTRNCFLNYSPAVYILEPNPLALAVALHVYDWRELLADPRVFVWAGEDCGERFVAALSDAPELPIPREHVKLLGWGPKLDPPPPVLTDRIRFRRDTRCQALKAEVDAMYAGCDAAYWARRYVSAGRPGEPDGDPLRVCLLVGRHTTYLKYCIRDLAAAFETRGIKTTILTEEADFTSLAAETCLKRIRSFRPDLFLIIDHFRHEYKGAIPANLPFVGWVQDQLPHLYDRKCGESLGPLDFFITPNGLGSLGAYGYPEGQGFTWIAGTDAREYSNEPMPEETLDRHRCDFSYVSHQSGLPESLRDEWRKGAGKSEVCVRLVDCIYEVLAGSLQRDARTAFANRDWLLETIEDEFGIAPPSEEVRHRLLHFYIYPLAELMFRQSTLEWVADFCDRTGRVLHLYGNGWDEHPRFSAYARGPARNGEQLRAIYQASRVNLQIIGTGAVHQRLLDGLAAGGFFLLRYSPSDTMREPGLRLLHAVRRAGLQPGKEYRCDEVPEAGEAWRGLRNHMGAPLTRDRFTLPRHGIDRLAELEINAGRQLAGVAFDCYADVSFGTREEFEALASRYLSNPAERAALAASMRAVVIDTFTYGGLVDRLIPFIRERLAATAGKIPPG